MATMMLVDVDEDCTNTVTKTPIINPIMGLLKTALLPKTYESIINGKPMKV